MAQRETKIRLPLIREKFCARNFSSLWESPPINWLKPPFPWHYESCGQRAISADVALRLGKYFGMTPQFWMTCKPTTTCDVQRQRA